MNLIRHSKYKNTGILFELLVRQITADTLNGVDSPVKNILQKYFVKTELGREYKLYETLLKRTSLTDTKADIIINTLIESSKTLNRGAIRRQKYNLIKEIKEHYNIEEFFNHKIPHYKTHAAFYTLVEAYNTHQADPEQIIVNRVTLLEHLTIQPVTEAKVREGVMSEFEHMDKDVRLLTYKIMLEKFNDKYDTLDTNQKSVLKEYINSVDNSPRLKEFYTVKVNEIKQTLADLNNKTTNQVTQIKINEIINMIKVPSKTTKVNENNLVDLLQYYDLVNELKAVNG